MIRAVSLAMLMMIGASEAAPSQVVKNYRTGNLISLSFPALKDAATVFKYLPDQEEHLAKIRIIDARIINFQGRKYECGLAKGVNGSPQIRRFAICLEVDWQIWEPAETDLSWHAWNETFEHICGSVSKGEE